MKKIHADVKNNDQIIVHNTPGKLHFFYRKSRSCTSYYLYTMKFSPSVFTFFKNGGHTLNELYHFHAWHNPKLVKVMERLPQAIEYVLKEEQLSLEPADAHFKSTIYER